MLRLELLIKGNAFLQLVLLMQAPKAQCQDLIHQIRRLLLHQLNKEVMRQGRLPKCEVGIGQVVAHAGIVLPFIDQPLKLCLRALPITTRHRQYGLSMPPFGPRGIDRKDTI